MKSTTIASPIVSNMLEGARAQGYNIQQILLEVGISPNILQQERARITFEQLSRLSRRLMTLLGDENLGLLDRPQRQNTFKLACYSALNATTIGEALGIFVEFMNIMEGSLVHERIDFAGGARYQLRRRPHSVVRNSYAIEHTLFTFHRTLSWMANARIPILEASLDYPAPSYSSEYRYIFMGAPIAFDKAHCAISLSSHSLKLQNVRDIDQLKEFLKLAPLTLLSQTTPAMDLSAQLRTWVERQLLRHNIAPDIDTAAAYFALHPQALRRQLMKQGSSYQQIKMEARRDLAINLLHDKDLSVEAVGSQLDFSEPSAFIRAFKSWTGLTPLAYRRLARQ
jgi:AraC-like DNA-binding protein